ncbi:MAG: DNA integrity scanning diadenylate cyclase DisA [Candidatus Pacearchaeota archaeon]
MDLEIIKLFSYGSALRNSIEKIIKSGRGALIVFLNNKKMTKIFKGGFKINQEFTAERLAELSKLDGAIVVDDKLKKILYANVLLHPSIKIASSETGTRHQAAERTAKQFNALVLAISEKAKTATLYYGTRKMKLNSLNELFTKTGEGLKTLEKNKEIFQSLIKRLNAAETLELVMLEDIALIFQRKKIIDTIIKTINTYLAELGTEGQLIEMQLKEIVGFIEREIELIIKDYSDYFNFDSIQKAIDELSYDEILNKETFFVLFLANKRREGPFIPKGYRVLKGISILTEDNINSLVEHFGNFKNIILATQEDFSNIKGISEKKAKAIKDYLLKLQI